MKEIVKNESAAVEPVGQPPSVSHAEFVQILRMENVNGAGRLFGGDLIAWMDDVSAISARRYAHAPVTTACIENLRFLRPAYHNESMVVTGRVIYTGRTSMEVLVMAEVERFTGERELVADGRFILVALDENERPCPVPPLLPETEQEKAWYREARERREKK